MNKTKLIVTLDQNATEYDDIKNLIIQGTDAFRLDLKYCSFEKCTNLIKKINKANEELKTYTSIILDTSGVLLKTNSFENGFAEYKTDDIIRIYNSNIIGDCTKLSINYNELINDIFVNDIITINHVKFEVINKLDDCVQCKVLTGGIVKDNSIISIPNLELFIPIINSTIINEIEFACNSDIDYLALSDIKCGEDVLQVSDQLINLKNNHIKILSKIDNLEAVDNIDSIINVSDGIMLIRDDMTKELPIERIPGIQKKIINNCLVEGKISIISTDITIDENDILSSFVSDIANAVLDGVDSILLNKLNGDALELINNIEKITKQVELDTNYLKLKNIALRSEDCNVTGVIASQAVDAAGMLKCKIILVPTKTGITATKISRFRPSCPILAISPDIDTVKSLSLYYGVTPVLVNEINTLDSIINVGKKEIKKRVQLNELDKIVITGGYPFKESKHTNFIKIEEI